MTETNPEFDLAALEEGSEGWKSLRNAYAKQANELKALKTEKTQRERASGQQTVGIQCEVGAALQSLADE